MKRTLLIIMLTVAIMLSGCTSSSVTMFNVPEIQDNRIDSKCARAAEDPGYKQKRQNQKQHVAENEHNRSRRREWKESVKKIHQIPIKIAGKFIDKIKLSKSRFEASKIKKFFRPSDSQADRSDETHL